MFANNTFYFSLTRKYVALFGTLFNDIYITRTNDNDQQTALIRVPITYGPKEKMLARTQQDPNIDRPSATLPLPSMSFEFGSPTYDASRKTQTTLRTSYTNADKSKQSYQYVPVPYDLSFTLYVYAKHSEDAHKIIEQIVPFFTPNFTVSTNIIPELNEQKDIITVLNNITREEIYEGDFKSRQMILWTLEFTMHAFYYGPIVSSRVIKFVNTQFYTPTVEDLSDAVGNTDPLALVTVQPGLLANGSPTSNAAASIAVSEIDVTDDFGYVVTITEGEDLL